MTAHPRLEDWPSAAPRLATAAADDRDWYRMLARELVRPTDRLAADIGCGGAGMTLAMAATMVCGRIIAVDDEPAVLAEAQRAVREGWSDPRIDITVTGADIAMGTEQLRACLAGAADLIWASAVIHHLPDQQAAVTGLADLLARGGRLALAEGGLPSRHLPWDLGCGEPGIELRLLLAQDRWFAAMRAAIPGTTAMPYGWTEALKRAGLQPVTTATTLVEHRVPLDGQGRSRILTSLTDRVRRVADAGLLDEADTAVWRRLLDEKDDQFLGRRADLTSVEARSVHVGVRP